MEGNFRHLSSIAVPSQCIVTPSSNHAPSITPQVFTSSSVNNGSSLSGGRDHGLAARLAGHSSASRLQRGAVQPQNAFYAPASAPVQMSLVPGTLQSAAVTSRGLSHGNSAFQVQLPSAMELATQHQHSSVALPAQQHMLPAEYSVLQGNHHPVVPSRLLQSDQIQSNPLQSDIASLQTAVRTALVNSLSQQIEQRQAQWQQQSCEPLYLLPVLCADGNIVLANVSHLQRQVQVTQAMVRAEAHVSACHRPVIASSSLGSSDSRLISSSGENSLTDSIPTTSVGYVPYGSELQRVGTRTVEIQCELHADAGTPSTRSASPTPEDPAPLSALVDSDLTNKIDQQGTLANDIRIPPGQQNTSLNVEKELMSYRLKPETVAEPISPVDVSRGKDNARAEGVVSLEPKYMSILEVTKPLTEQKYDEMLDPRVLPEVGIKEVANYYSSSNTSIDENLDRNFTHEKPGSSETVASNSERRSGLPVSCIASNISVTPPPWKKILLSTTSPTSTSRSPVKHVSTSNAPLVVHPSLLKPVHGSKSYSEYTAAGARIPGISSPAVQPSKKESSSVPAHPSTSVQPFVTPALSGSSEREVTKIPRSKRVRKAQWQDEIDFSIEMEIASTPANSEQAKGAVVQTSEFPDYPVVFVNKPLTDEQRVGRIVNDYRRGVEIASWSKKLTSPRRGLVQKANRLKKYKHCFTKPVVDYASLSPHKPTMESLSSTDSARENTGSKNGATVSTWFIDSPQGVQAGLPLARVNTPPRIRYGYDLGQYTLTAREQDSCARIRPLEGRQRLRTSFSDSCARCIPYSRRFHKRDFNWFYPLVHTTRNQEVSDAQMAQDLRRYTMSSTAELPLPLQLRYLPSKPSLTRLGRSKVHGVGLFARFDIAKGELLLEYVGQIIRSSLADHRESKYQSMTRKLGVDYVNMFRLDNERVVDATLHGGRARFINHSCAPTCYAKVITHEQKKRILLLATRDIDEGEEISYDYKLPFEKDRKIRCHCQAPNCRKFLN